MALFRRRKTSRSPVADLDTTSLEVGGSAIALADVLVAARVAGRGLQVSVYHPSFADLPDETRLEAAVEVLVATLGEEGLHRSVVDISPATHPPIDPFGLSPLRAFVQSLGVTIEPEGD